MFLSFFLFAITTQQKAFEISFDDPLLQLGKADESLSKPLDAVYNGDHFYILDQKEYAIVVFDRTGVQRYRFGQKGQGPGEFQQPVSLGFHGKSILVYDGSRSRIIFFNTDWKFEREVLVGRGNGGFFWKNSLVLHSTLEPNLFSVYRLNGKEIASFGAGMAGKVDTGKILDKLYFFYVHNDNFWAMNTTGKVALTCKLEDDSVTGTQEYPLDFEHFTNKGRIKHKGPGNMEFIHGQPVQGLGFYGGKSLVLFHNEYEEEMSYLGLMDGSKFLKIVKTKRFYNRLSTKGSVFLFRLGDGIVDVFSFSN